MEKGSIMSPIRQYITMRKRKQKKKEPRKAVTIAYADITIKGPRKGGTSWFASGNLPELATARPNCDLKKGLKDEARNHGPQPTYREEGRGKNTI